MNIVAFNDHEVGIVMGIESITGVVIHFVVEPAAAEGAIGVRAPKTVMNAAVPDVVPLAGFIFSGYAVYSSDRIGIDSTAPKLALNHNRLR
jgi:hypothetical protein